MRQKCPACGQKPPVKMKKGGGRQKGSGFEREVAKLVIAAFACKGICGEDCYRTPGSGGHKQASKTDPGDLVISRRLQKLFPFAVECKFYKAISMDLLMVPNVKEGVLSSWWAQAVASAGRRVPLLIFRQNRQQAYAMFPGTYPHIETLRGLFNGEIATGLGLRPFIKTKVNGQQVYVVRLKTLLRYYKKANS